MQKTHVCEIDGQTYELQSPSLRGYMTWSDRLNNGKIDTYEYSDWMLKNSVTSPLEIKSQGNAYFEGKDKAVAIIESIVFAINDMFR